jgi:hypothetical protein
MATYKAYWSLAFIKPHVSCGITFTITRASESATTVSISPELRFGFDDTQSAITESRTCGLPLYVKYKDSDNWYTVSASGTNW